jgi:hypothetical protein
MHRVQSGEVCKIFSLGMMDHETAQLVTMCLHETYNPVCIDKHFQIRMAWNKGMLNLIVNTNKWTFITNTLSHIIHQHSDMFRSSSYHPQAVIHQTSVHKTDELLNRLKLLINIIHPSVFHNPYKVQLFQSVTPIFFTVKIHSRWRHALAL